jgi:hypothetical protein
MEAANRVSSKDVGHILSMVLGRARPGHGFLRGFFRNII